MEMTAQDLTDVDELLDEIDANSGMTPEDVAGPIVDLLEFLSDNTGVLGDYKPSGATLKLGGSNLEVWSQTELDHHENLMTWVEDHDGLRIKSAGIKKLIGHDVDVVPSVTVTTEE